MNRRQRRALKAFERHIKNEKQLDSPRTAVRAGSVLDSGLIYAPYVPLQTTPVGLGSQIMASKSHRRVLKPVNKGFFGTAVIGSGGPGGTVGSGGGGGGQVFTNTGTWSKPQGAQQVQVQVWGGGGGGGNMSGGGGGLGPPHIVSAPSYEQTEFHLREEVACVARQLLGDLLTEEDYNRASARWQIWSTLKGTARRQRLVSIIYCQKGPGTTAIHQEIIRVVADLFRRMSNDTRLSAKTRKAMAKRRLRLLRWSDLPVVELLAELE